MGMLGIEASLSSKVEVGEEEALLQKLSGTNLHEEDVKLRSLSILMRMKLTVSQIMSSVGYCSEGHFEATSSCSESSEVMGIVRNKKKGLALS